MRSEVRLFLGPPVNLILSSKGLPIVGKWSLTIVCFVSISKVIKDYSIVKATKGEWGMPWHLETMKDVVKLR